jgi:hypothetical protein
MNCLGSVWNSLEIAKLIVQGLIPLLILLLGIIVNRSIKRLEHRQWRNQKLIEKRLEIYNDMAPMFNDLLCYFTYVGCWKDLSPVEVIKIKRGLDKKIYLAAPLFPPQFFQVCMDFLDLCYETFAGWGEDAKLKTMFEHRKQAAGEGWLPEWDRMYSTQPIEPSDIRVAYQSLMHCFSDAIGLEDKIDSFILNKLPTNIK